MIRRILLGALLVVVVFADSTFDTSWDICFRQKAYPKNSFQQDLLYNRISMNEVEAWILLVLSSLALLQAAVIFGLYFVYRELRVSPGDIFLGSLFFECFIGVHYLYESVSYITTHLGMLNYSFTCQTNSVLTILGNYGQFFYVITYFYYIRQKMKASFSPDKFGTGMMHLVIFISTWLVVLFYIMFELTGKTPDGLCGIQYGQIDQAMIGILFLGFIAVYFGMAGYSLFNLYKLFPKGQKYNKAQQDFFRFSLMYFLAFLICMFLIVSTSAIGGLNCEYTYNINLQVFYSISNVFGCLSIICLPIVRCQDPYTKLTLKKILSRKSQINAANDLRANTIGSAADIKINQESILDTTLGTSELLQGESKSSRQSSQDLIVRKSRSSFALREAPLKVSQARTSMVRDISFDSSYVDLIQSTKRTCVMFKVVCSLILDDKSKYHQVDGLNITNIKSDTNIFDEKKIYQFSDDDFFQNIPNIPPQSFFDEMKEKKQTIKMTSHAPIIFHSLMFREKEPVKLSDSLDIVENMSRIKHSGTNDGGKSGQFFFFSHDNKLMLKTISNQELRILLQTLQEYFMYLQGNRDSLIAKIYGIFTFEGVNDQAIHFILMKNLGRCNKQCILRIYDLKGSSYDREVIKKTDKNLDLTKMVLKDLDFLRLEKQINVVDYEDYKVAPQDKDYIIQNATADAEFFRKCGLIDYSLIVFKIDWRKMIEMHPDAAEQLDKFNQHVYPSTTEENIKYHIGIIDYLQEYDVSKKMEKYSKKFIKFNTNLDTSSQDPKTYSSRFKQFIRAITTGIGVLP